MQASNSAEMRPVAVHLAQWAHQASIPVTPACWECWGDNMVAHLNPDWLIK